MKWSRKRWIATDKDHKMRTGKRSIPESICDNRKCKFYGKPAAQGVCYSRVHHIASSYWDTVMKNGESLLASMRANHKKYSKIRGRAFLLAWVKQLEGQVVCTWANNTLLLDELVHLRAENARLKLQLGKWKGSR